MFKSLKEFVLGDFHRTEKNENNLGLSSTLTSRKTYFFNEKNEFCNAKLAIKKQDFYNFYH